jgi:TolB protein
MTRSWMSVAAISLGALMLHCGGDESEDEPSVHADRGDSAVRLDVELTGSLQNAAWSPQGDAFVITRFREGYNSEPADLYIVDVDGDVGGELVSDGSANVNLPGAAWNSVTEEIVFSSSREPHDEIYVIGDSASSGGERQVTSRSDRMAYEPSFSPDGQRIVFESHLLDQEDNGVITVVAADGTGDYVALTAEDDDCRQPNWSPAGGKIVYQRFDGTSWEIWSIDEDGTNPTQLTSGSGDKTDASFSPDGEWIVYSADGEELEFANLFITSVDGADPIRVTNWGGYDGAPSWSPDGTRIVFESYPGDPDDSEGTSLWMIDAPTL